MPQTREHLAIVDLLGLKRGIVAVTKIDPVARARRRVETQIANLLLGSALEGADMFPVHRPPGGASTICAPAAFGSGGRRQLRARPSAPSASRSIVPSRLPAGNSRQDRHRSGVVGPATTISPRRATRCASVRSRAEQAGRRGRQRCRSIWRRRHEGSGGARRFRARAGIARRPTASTRASGLLSSEKRALAQWTPARASCGTAMSPPIVLLGDDPVAPGEEALVQVVLEQKIAASVGDLFVLRDTTAQRTIGGGTMLDRRRRTSVASPERRAILRALALAIRRYRRRCRSTCRRPSVDLTAFARVASRRRAGRSHVRRTRRAGLAGGRQPRRRSRGNARTHDRKPRTKLAAFHADNPDLGRLVERPCEK